MRYLPAVPEGEDKPFLPAIPSDQIPIGNYIKNDILVPYESPQRMEILPEHAADFRLIIEGKLPFIIAPRGSIQKSRINAQLAVLLNNLNNIQAWNDMLIQVQSSPGYTGREAKLYLIDRHNRRYLVLGSPLGGAELDPGRETGTLLLQPIGRRGRGGQKIRLDPEDLVDYSTDPPTPFGLPVILYKSYGPTRKYRRNSDEEVRRLERQVRAGDISARKALGFARLRAGQPIDDMEDFAEILDQVGVYEALSNPRIAAVYEQDWFISTAQQMFMEAVKKMALDQRWGNVIHEVEVEIEKDLAHPFYDIEVEIKFTAPSPDEAEERQGIFEHEFIDWSDERRRDYRVEIEFDEWTTELDTESDEGQFDDRLQELFDQGLDEDDIKEMDGPDIPQSAEVNLFND